MDYDFVLVDVFTDELFGGNPLAVFTDARGLSPRAMQALARELNFPESTFVLPPDDDRATARVRIFTPRAELPFAGHPTVGTAAVLARARGAAWQDDCAELVLEEGIGRVNVAVRRLDAQLSAELTLEQPVTLPAAIPDRAAVVARGSACGMPYRLHAGVASNRSRFLSGHGRSFKGRRPCEAIRWTRAGRAGRTRSCPATCKSGVS